MATLSKFTPVCLTVAAPLLITVSSFANNTPQTLPFTQSWTNTGLIAANDDWSAVPGVIGYLGDVDPGSPTAVDPQTVLGPAVGAVDVIANQANPNTQTQGGVAEFEIADPVVALQGSGTADAPSIVIHLNTSGQSNIQIQYNLRDVDGSTDNAIQPIALQYRVGSSSAFTNIPAGFVADATTGPSQATLVTPVSAALPTAAWNQPLVQVRILTTNALGFDEWVGIDDILIAVAGGPDSDGDGVPDGIDNCPDDPNPLQEDCDADGVGDACDDPCPVDTDGDGIPDDLDNCPAIANPLQEDCNENTVGDVCDIDAGKSFDCNLNGVPDECEPDCNLSGFPDDCDIDLGISEDCNLNGTPDECEPDCDENKIPDDCDIDKNPALDANGDGILDECQNFISVVINEILADPPSNATGDANNDGTANGGQDEFVEIVNNSGAAVNMSGWSINDLVGVRHLFPAGTIVANQCTVLVFGGGNPTGQFGGGVVQTASTGSGTLELNNTGDTITLRDSGGLFVTSVTYGVEGNEDTSLTRVPDITGPTPLVKHNTVAPGSAIYSPGRRVDGSPFSGCSVQPDQDFDGIPDSTDNCPSTANANQADCDDDGQGDLCEDEPDKNDNDIPDNCEIGVPEGLVINEVRIDQPDVDCDEYVELAGPPGLSLNGLTLIVIGDDSGGDDGRIETVISLQGSVIPADGLFLMAEAQFDIDGAAPDKTLAAGDASCNNGGLNLENSDNITIVLVTNFFGALGEDLDTNNDGAIDVTPWGDVVDAVGVIEETFSPPTPPANTEFAYGAALGFEDVGPDAIFAPAHIYRCMPTGAWTIGLFNPFKASPTDTPGTPNLNCPSDCPGDIDPPPNGNGTVNIDDLFVVIAGWGACPQPCPPSCAADIDDDCDVDIDDLFTVIATWGDCP